MGRAQKQRKNTNHNAMPQYEVANHAALDVVGSDALAAMSDEELISRRQDLDNLRRVLSGAMDKMIDVELAYVQREFQLRHNRHEAHNKYLNTMMNEAREAMAEEAALPNIDFSNVEYVRLYAEYRSAVTRF